MNKFKLLALTVSLSAQVFAQSEEYKLLSERRIALPSYTTEQKLLVINQAEFTFKSLFVHKDLKIKHFGTAADPIPALEKLKANVANMSEQQFHSQMVEIFARVNDLHTTYQLPKPYACYRNILPFELKDAITEDGKRVVAVQSIESNPAIIQILGRRPQIKIGDVLTKINGESVESVIRSQLHLSLGANKDAARRISIGNITWSSQKIKLAPKENEVTFTFINSNGEEYEEVLPWVNREVTSCIKSMEPSESGDSATNEEIIERKQHFRKKSPLRKSLKISQEDKFSIQNTEEPIIRWKLIKNENGIFGYIKLESFVPEKLSIDESVNLVKKIVQTEFHNTTGMIIDVRDNGGGKIRLGEKMVQLFTPKKIQPLNFLLKASSANLHYLENTPYESSYTPVLKEALAAGAEYTKAIPLNEEAGLNNLGQIYDMPVAIFTNANCYSTCDMMSASMQDHGVATIFGEDTTTGAGGANNVTLSSFYTELENKGPFVLMPEFQDIGLSWRQTIRVGKNEGQVLEDIGVLSDMVVPNRIADLKMDSVAQYGQITKALKKQAEKRSSININFSELEVIKGSKATINLKWKNTDKIRLMADGYEVMALNVARDNAAGMTLDIPEAVSGTLGGKNLELIGSLSGRIAWKRKIYLRVIPQTINLDSGISMDFSNGHKLLLIGKNGWKSANGKLSIGDGTNYANFAQTEASLFLNLNSSNASLILDLDMISEENYDYFKILVRADGKETQLEKISGTKSETDLKYDLSQFAGKNVEIVLKFDSDEMVNEGRVIVDNLRVIP